MQSPARERHNTVQFAPLLPHSPATRTRSRMNSGTAHHDAFTRETTMAHSPGHLFLLRSRRGSELRRTLETRQKLCELASPTPQRCGRRPTLYTGAAVRQRGFGHRRRPKFATGRLERQSYAVRIGIVGSHSPTVCDMRGRLRAATLAGTLCVDGRRCQHAPTASSPARQSEARAVTPLNPSAAAMLTQNTIPTFSNAWASARFSSSTSSNAGTWTMGAPRSRAISLTIGGHVCPSTTGTPALMIPA